MHSVSICIFSTIVEFHAVGFDLLFAAKVIDAYNGRPNSFVIFLEISPLHLGSVDLASLLFSDYDLGHKGEKPLVRWTNKQQVSSQP